MKFVIYSDAASAFEHWDWTNPDTVGIGGSEVSHIEMARRLATRGHEVISYAPVPFQGSRVNEGVLWRSSAQPVEKHEDALWIVYRSPRVADELEGQTAWLICQDIFYDFANNLLTPERASKFKRIVGLCEDHCTYLKQRLPEQAHLVCQSSNGLKREMIEDLAPLWKDMRESYKLIYPSSPDRGLLNLVKIFQRVREVLPQTELHVFYGLNNIDKVVSRLKENHPVAINTANIRAALQQPGVVWHGRIGQARLCEEWLTSSLWVHPSNFHETSCITCMDAQACGAIPITNPVWAVRENVKHGVFVEGSVEDSYTQSLYVLETIKLLVDRERQEEIRKEMMPWALKQHDWENVVSQWIDWAVKDSKPVVDVWDESGSLIGQQRESASVEAYA